MIFFHLGIRLAFRGDMDASVPITTGQYQSLLTGRVGALREAPLLETQFTTQTILLPTFKADAGSALAYLKQHGQRLLAKVFVIGPKTQERLAKAGLPPLAFKQITKNIMDILNDATLTKAEKKDKIEALRKETGLGRKEMRELFTGRLEKIIKASKAEVESYREALLNNLTDELNTIEATQGKNSPAALELRAEIDKVENVFKPYIEQLEANRGLLGGLYGGKSCIKRTFGAIGSAIGGAFKQIGSFLKKVVAWSPIGLLGRVPGIRTLVSPILEAVNKVIDLATQPLRIIKKTFEWTRDFFRNPWQTIHRGIRKVGSFLKDNWRWLTPLALNAIPGVGPLLSHVSASAIRGYELGKAAYNTIKDIGRQTWDWANDSWNGLKETLR